MPCKPLRKSLLSRVIITGALPLFADIALADSPGETHHHTDATDLPTVSVRSIQGAMRPGALRDEIIRTESIDEKAIERAGATNINEALDKNPGIAVQVECSICNVRNVLLNNLPGRYTTLMLDGVPIFSSVSSAYGLDSVSVYGIERIDVARGAGASLIAPEALAGTVDIVTKHPLEAENRLRLQAGEYGSRQADAYFARPFNGGAVTATFNYNKHDSIDEDGDRISEYSGYDRRLGSIGLFLDDIGGFKVRSRLDIVDEKRGGGALGDDYSAIKSDDRGNPFNWSRSQHGSPDPGGWINPSDGSVIPYDDGRGGFSEIIFTKREQWIGTAERNLGGGKLRLAAGAARHRQDSFYELSTYIGEQYQYYAEAAWTAPVGDGMLTTGANYRYEDLKSHGHTANGTPVNGIDSYRYETPAAFLQYYRALLDERLEFNGSVRYDHHNVFGGIFSPRLNLLYHHTPRLSSRFSAGTGFRAPTSFFEQDHGILDTIQIIRDIDDPEISYNASYALSYADDRLAMTGSYNYNRIKNFALLDSSAVDDLGNPVTLFTSSPGKVVVQGIDINASCLLTPALTLSLAGEVSFYRFPPGTLIFARPDHKAYLGLDYEPGRWDISAKLVWTGSMNLRKFHGDGSGEQHRFNFDGTPKRNRSPGFFTVDLRAEYAVSDMVSLYAGADNLFDYAQADDESFLFVDYQGTVDVTHLWGPSRGRYLYAGIKLGF
ncbi:MAG: TonB-dependent receptor [Xanthomonadaceae bacterium]|jgi:outer membrane receptor for ferrienterochelin and colicins|nr:TonB-dependent receptor [Xanthomonadaceae bacterium]